MFKIIVNSLIFLLILSSYALCQPITQDNSQILAILDKNESFTPFSTEILLDKIYAVHATRCLPDPDYLRAGFSLDNVSPLEKTMMPKARQTLHFALGELVRPVEGFMSWEDCRYAVITPLQVLLPQLILIVTIPLF
jgi:hypothetical protein